MKVEENVDVETTLTEEKNTVEGAMSCPKEETSTVLGKFKDVDALSRAYEALQAEFTRRSQRLRSLEKEVENFKASGAEPSGVEKLRKTAKAKREAAKQFDAFLAEVGEEAAREAAREKPAQEEKDTQEENAAQKVTTPQKVAEAQEKSCLEERKETLPTPTKAFGQGSPSAEGESSEELYLRASKDESVRLKIVGEYLSSLGRSGAPVTGGGVGVLATPPARATTVGQAGNMALLYFRKSQA